MLVVFFFNDTATTEIYTLSLHDALPICTNTLAQAIEKLVEQAEAHAKAVTSSANQSPPEQVLRATEAWQKVDRKSTRLELQSRQYLVCRLLLEKKKIYYLVFDVFEHHST